MADLSTFASAAAARSEILTKGAGATPITDGEDNPFFYEEGIWTPTIEGSSSAGDYSLNELSSNANTYVLTGRQVVLRAGIEITINSAGSGTMLLTGLPYNQVEGYTNFTSAVLSNIDYTGFDYCLVGNRPGSSSDILVIRKVRSSNTPESLDVAGLNTGSRIEFTLTYKAVV